MLFRPRSLETPYETESQHESVAFFVPSAHVQVEVHPTVIQAGSRLIQYLRGNTPAVLVRFLAPGLFCVFGRLETNGDIALQFILERMKILWYVNLMCYKICKSC